MRETGSGRSEGEIGRLREQIVGLADADCVRPEEEARLLAAPGRTERREPMMHQPVDDEDARFCTAETLPISNGRPPGSGPALQSAYSIASSSDMARPSAHAAANAASPRAARPEATVRS
jgi:hypothetical protein